MEGQYPIYRNNVRIMERKMETTRMGYIGYIVGLYWGYMGMMESKMETTIMGYILGLHWGYSVKASSSAFLRA